MQCRSSAVVPKNKLTKKVNLLVPGGIKADFFFILQEKINGRVAQIAFPLCILGTFDGNFLQQLSSNWYILSLFYVSLFYDLHIFIILFSSAAHFQLVYIVIILRSIYISIFFFSSSLQTGIYFHYFMIHTFSLFSSIHFHSFMMYIFALHIFVHYSFHT